VLRRYAGTSVPALVLIKYGADAKCLAAAIRALYRFDIVTDNRGKKHEHVAAHFLIHYQEHPEFKAALARHGEILIPALSAGGKDALSDIVRNPNDIYKDVNPDGTPKGTPWWTWIPGGSLVYAINEVAEGRTLRFSEVALAIVDLLVLYEVAGTTVRLGTTLIRTGARESGEAAARSLVPRGLRKAAEAGAHEARICVFPGGKMTAGETVRLGGKALAMAEASSFLAASGRRVSEKAWLIVKFVGKQIASHPVRSVVLGVATWYVVSKVSAAFGMPIPGPVEIGADLAKRVFEAVLPSVKEIPKGLPGWVSWLLTRLAILLLWVAIPLWLLKKLLPPLFERLMEAVKRLLLLPVRAMAYAASRRVPQPPTAR